MSLPCWRRLLQGGWGAFLIGILTLIPCQASTSWISGSSGFWQESANWSGGVPTFALGLVLITNANTKTVTADANTPAENLAIDRITIAAPPGQTNTLAIEELAATELFQIIGLGAVNRGGAIRVNNSTLFVDGPNGGSLDVNGGELSLISGAVTLGKFGRFRLGVSDSAVLNITGGVFTAGDDFLVGAGLTGGAGTVNITGGELKVTLTVVLGDDPGATGTILMNGGTLIATNDLMITRIGDDGIGVMSLQSGNVEFWDVSVGRSLGAQGRWDISGGTAQCKDISVGRFEGATGVLNVSGGSLLLHSLIIGREGSGQVNVTGGLIDSSHVAIATNSTSSGTLTMDGGVLETSDFLVGTNGSAAGTVTINNGTMRATNDTMNARFNVINGTVTVNGGLVEADSLAVTNSTGTLRFNGGTIQSAGTVINNGQAFVVGDGTHPAVFRLNGGTHIFQNGLVISQNASVVGCGQIVGTIQNSGILSTNCGVAAPSLSDPQRNGTQFTFAIQTQANVTYTVEYKDSLSDPAWTKLRDYAGTGGAVAVTDSIAAGSRFYRAVIY